MWYDGLRQTESGNVWGVGVAESPEGALYVSDDKGGRIWQIQYNAP